MIDLNSKSAMGDRINFLIDEAIATVRDSEKPREYLGASLAGHQCDRYVQYQWLVILKEFPGEVFPPRILRIFDRGNLYEQRAKLWLQGAGFLFVPDPPAISDFDGKFGGHVDGILAGFFPGVSPIALPALWENKTLGAKGYKAIKKDGLRKYSPIYYEQVNIYMGYLQLPRCLFTVVNSDSMELLHILIEFSSPSFEMMKDKIRRIFNATNLGELLPRCTQDKEFYLCKWCPFREICWK